MYYSMTDNEVFNAYDFWHKLPGGAKVVLQWQGGDQNKTHPELMHVLDYLKSLKCKICVLDHRKTGPQQYRAPALGVRFALSLCATADLFVGYDSGPFYAAIGGLVPSVGLFPNEHPDDIFTPIRVPDYSCLYMKSDLSKIKIEHIIVEIDRLWYGYGLAKIPYSLTGDHNAKNKIIRPISRHPNF